MHIYTIKFFKAFELTLGRVLVFLNAVIEFHRTYIGLVIHAFILNFRKDFHFNKHKAMSLLSLTGVLTRDRLKELDKTGVPLKALEIVYMHQGSGFSIYQGGESPNEVTTLLQQVPNGG